MPKVIIPAIAIIVIALGALLLGRRSPKTVAGAPRTPGDASTEPGRAAIDRALDSLYPSERDHRFGLKPGPGEKEAPLEEVVAYRAKRPSPHWHYVTYGLSELGAKSIDDREHSGFGIELSLRLADDSESPPIWPINYLRWLASTVWRDGVPFDETHSVPHPPGLLDEVSRGADGALFIRDPALGEIVTANGKVKFLQVLPLTADEHALIGQWDATRVLEEMRREDQNLFWRVGRASILAGALSAEIRRRAAEEGSAQEVDFTSELTWDERGIHLDALNRWVVLKQLRYRIAYGRPARIHSEGHVLRLEPGPFERRLDTEPAVLSIPRDRATALAQALEKGLSHSVVTFEGRPVFVLGELSKLERPFQ